MCSSRTLLLLFALMAALAPLPAVAADGNCVNAGCHTKYGQAPFVHDAMDNCVDCHKLTDGATQSRHEAKAKKASKEEDFELAKEAPDLCWDCHDNDADKVDNLHPPYEDGDCLECHDVHQSKQAALLKSNVQEVCFGCHDEIQEKVENSRVAHDPIDSKESCLTCHKPHGTDTEKLLKAKSVQKLCGEECHDDIVADIEAIPVDHRHGPVQKGKCQACHDVHGSPNTKLLRGSYPATPYAPYSSSTYKLCFGKCHDQKAFQEKGPTAFSTSEKSLHALHVNREKGRTCRFCHEPHAAVNEHLLKTSVPFGKWKFDLGWKNTGASDASCSPACHAEKKYNRALKPAEKKE